MPSHPGPGFDLVALAEDVVAGRRSFDNVIDQVAVATPDDRERRRRIAELESLIVGLTGVRSRDRGTGEAASVLTVSGAPEAASASTAPGATAAQGLAVEPPRARSRGRITRSGVVAAIVSAAALFVIVAAWIAGWIGPSAP